MNCVSSSKDYKASMHSASAPETAERAVINPQPVVGERRPAQLKPTSFHTARLDPTELSCPGLLHPRDGTVEKNKGVVTMISHTPPTSLLPHPDSRTRRRFSRMAFLVNSNLVLVLAEGGRAGNDTNLGFFLFF